MLVSVPEKFESQGFLSRFNTSCRPQFHFTPQKNWINDPNGMFFYNGKYHLFYQYNPGDSVWGDIHWGHAVSEDLVSWTELDPALFPDKGGLGMVFSGGAVVDRDNTSGLMVGEHPPIFLFFTTSNDVGNQQQSAAYSLDGGEKWIWVESNPVIPNTEIKDFRDPKVVWYAEGDYWVMALAVGQQIWLYKSSNLLEWEKLSEFGDGYGCHEGVWECPDLFQLTVGSESKWVLLVSINPGGPNGGSATQYFIGDFDGIQYKPADKKTRWMDYGPDNYASVTWDNLGTERIAIGWMSNWLYANFTPTTEWRGAMTLPRRLELHKHNDEFYLTNLPVASLLALCEDTITFGRNVQAAQTIVNESKHALWRIEIGLKTFESFQKDWFCKFSNEQGETLKLSYSAADHALVLDRSAMFCEMLKPELLSSYNRLAIAPLTSGDSLNLDIWIDKGAIEVFANNGETTLTAQYFSKSELTQLSVSESEALSNITISKLAKPDGTTGFISL